MVKMRPFLLFFIFTNIYTAQKITPVTGLKICEEIGKAHPFSVKDPEMENKERHSIILHINGKLKNDNHNIWFLIQSIQTTTQAVEKVETNHTTKKLIYEKGKLSLVGKKGAYANHDPETNLQVKEFSNLIIPRNIVWASKEEHQHTCALNTDRMAANDQTQLFCSTLLNRYGKSIVAIQARRKQIDRCPTADGDEALDLDCLPSSQYPMTIYFDLRTLPNFKEEIAKNPSENRLIDPHKDLKEQQKIEIICPKCQEKSSSTTPTVNEIRKKSTHHQSFFSSNKIIVFGCASLIAVALFFNFFEITITLKK